MISIIVSETGSTRICIGTLNWPDRRATCRRSRGARGRRGSRPSTWTNATTAPGEADEHRAGRDPGRRRARDPRAGERDQQRSRERARAGRARSGGDHPRSSVSVSTSSGILRRVKATIRPRPTTHLGGGDRHHRDREDLAVDRGEVAREPDEGEVRGVEHDLEREQHDQRAPPQDHAGRADPEEDGGDGDVPGRVRARALRVVLRRGLHPEHDAADGGDEQHDRGDLEGEQVVGEEQPADLGRAPERARDLARCRRGRRRPWSRARRSPRSGSRRRRRTPRAGASAARRPTAHRPARRGRRSRRGTSPSRRPRRRGSAPRRRTRPTRAGRARRARRGSRSARAPSRTGS